MMRLLHMHGYKRAHIRRFFRYAEPFLWILAIFFAVFVPIIYILR
jgi:hypothetical protein